MAIKKEFVIAALLKLGMKQADIDTAIEGDEEKDLTLPEVTVYDAAGLESLKTNLQASNKKAIREILIKDMKTKAGLEYDGKDEDTFIEKLKEAAVAEAKVPANEAKAQWEKDKKALQDKLDLKDNEIATIKGQADAASMDATLLSHFPANRNPNLSNEDYLTILRNNIKVTEEDGVKTVLFNGKPLQDDKLNPLPIDAAVTHIFTEKKWISDATATTPAGLGGGDTTKVPGKVSNMREAKAHIAAQGWNETSEQARVFVEQAAAANPSFDFATN